MRSLCLAILCSLLGTTVSIEPTATQVFWLTCRVFISYARMVCIVRDVWCGVKLKREQPLRLRKRIRNVIY